MLVVSLCSRLALNDFPLGGCSYDLKTHDIQHNLKLWRHTYQVFDRAGMEECGPVRWLEPSRLNAGTVVLLGLLLCWVCCAR